MRTTLSFSTKNTFSFSISCSFSFSRLPEALLIDFLIEWSDWQQNESNETFNKHFGSVITDRLVVAADCLCNSNKPSMIHKKY